MTDLQSLPPSETGYYLIKSKLNGYVLDITGSNQEPGTPVISFPINGEDGTPNQQWTITPEGLIKSKLNGFVLDITGSNQEPCTPIVAYPANGGTGTPNQQWTFTTEGLIKSKMNGFVLDITGSNQEPCAQIISYPVNGATGTPNQHWELVPISDDYAKGKIVVNADEWTLSDAGFQQCPDTGAFALNVAKYFVKKGKGKFHVLSNNFGLVGASLEQTMKQAGHTWTKGLNISVDVATLSQYDAVFVGGDPVNNQVLIDYVKQGGRVYLCGGTGQGGSQQEAANWNTFLTTFGLQFGGIYNGISGNIAINKAHPLFIGVKTLYQNNGNSITDLDPDSTFNKVILNSNEQGIIGIAKWVTEDAKTPVVHKGKIVVNADEWTLSNAGFQQSPDAAKFALNIAQDFAKNKLGKFHVLSNNFGLVESSLEQTMKQAGHTWTKGMNITIDVTTLLQYDGIFVGGDVVDNDILIAYVTKGGRVYLCGGTGQGGSQQEASNWNKFLTAFGLKFGETYNGISGNIPIKKVHPLFKDVKTLYQNNGNSISDLDADSTLNKVVLHYNEQGIIAIGKTF